MFGISAVAFVHASKQNVCYPQRDAARNWENTRHQIEHLWVIAALLVCVHHIFWAWLNLVELFGNLLLWDRIAGYCVQICSFPYDDMKPFQAYVGLPLLGARQVFFLHYGDLSWGTVSALAVTISDGYRLKHVMHILTFSTRGAIPQSMVGDIPSLAKTHPDKVPKLSAGTCSSFFSWNCGHAN